MEYLVSDIKNIKKSLVRIWKYILSKSIEDDKTNNIKDLKGIDKVAWEFILSLYKVHWNSLIMDNTDISFRNKVKSKFSSQVTKELSNGKDKNPIKPSYISTLPPPILAKPPKKINKISKYFNKNLIPAQKKFYA